MTACSNGGTPIYPDQSTRNTASQYALSAGVGQVGPTPSPTSSPARSFRWNSVIATDIALNYELPIHNFAFFAKAEVRNALNHRANIGGNTTVYTSLNNGSSGRGQCNSVVNLEPFNPFTQSPVAARPRNRLANCNATQGANYLLGPHSASRPVRPPRSRRTVNYQLPRTYLYAIGARF